MTEDASFASEQSGKKKKGLKKLGTVFRRRRRKKKDGSGQSVGSESDSYSEHSKDLILEPPEPTSQQQEWISSGPAGLDAIRTNSAVGRGQTLGKILELPEEEDEDGRRPRRGGRRRRGDGASVSSQSSRRSVGSFFRKERPKADPLSLVVLVVESSSLRFELLSLDFDLKSTRKGHRRRPGDLQLTVQDVLDQITPDALTDPALQKLASTPCKGLIDRQGGVHFGSASLEDACRQRPLRALDKVRLKQQQQALLSIPTYGGEPHRDVLVAFFADTLDDDCTAEEVAQQSAEIVTGALELARPIFCDPKVVQLMESNGFDLTGWNKKSVPQKAKLGKPLPGPDRSSVTKSSSLPIAKVVLGLVAILLATVLAWSLVAGGFHMLPSIASDSNATWEEILLQIKSKTLYWNSSDAVESVKRKGLFP